MYLEVPFINGYKEFIETLSKEITVTIDKDVTEYKVELLEDEVYKDSISYVNLSTKVLFLSLDLITENDRTFVRIKSPESLKDITLTLMYSYNNKEPKLLYSVDYSKGIIFFSEETQEEIEISFKTDRVFAEGKQARQLSDLDYNNANGQISIRNFKDNTSISFLSVNTKEKHRNISPVLTDLKFNYIVKDSQYV